MIKDPFGKGFSTDLNVLHGATSVLVALQSPFRCDNRKWGFFADISTGCRTFVQCVPTIEPNSESFVRRHVFQCPPGTQFDQRFVTCILTKDALPCDTSPLLFEETEQKFAVFGGCPDASPKKTEIITQVPVQEQLIESHSLIEPHASTESQPLAVPPKFPEQIHTTAPLPIPVFPPSFPASTSTGTPIMVHTMLHISGPSVAPLIPLPPSKPSALPFPVRLGKTSIKKPQRFFHAIKGNAQKSNFTPIVKKVIVVFPAKKPVSKHQPIKSFFKQQIKPFKQVFSRPLSQTSKHHIFISFGRKPLPTKTANKKHSVKTLKRPISRIFVKTVRSFPTRPSLSSLRPLKSPVHQLKQHQFTHSI